MELQEAKGDVTYCTKRCKNKCWRHESNYNFDKNRLYSFTNICIATIEEKREDKETTK